jgi:hypothetical protein
MRAPNYEIIQDLLIASAASDGAWVLVEGIDPHGRRERVRIGLPSPQAAIERLATIREWQDRSVPVTYIRSASGAALIDERAAFQRAMNG